MGLLGVAQALFFLSHQQELLRRLFPFVRTRRVWFVTKGHAQQLEPSVLLLRGSGQIL